MSTTFRGNDAAAFLYASTKRYAAQQTMNYVHPKFEHIKKEHDIGRFPNVQWPFKCKVHIECCSGLQSRTA